MASAFQLNPSVATLPLSLLRKRYEDMTPEERIAAGLVRPSTQDEFDSAMASKGGGAPADFAGRVFPNPDNVQISDDTDSGIPELRLPNGVSATTGSYTGTPKLDTSNPAAAQVLPAAMQTIAANTTQLTPDQFMAQQLTPDQFMAQQTPPATTGKEQPQSTTDKVLSFVDQIGDRIEKNAYLIPDVMDALRRQMKGQAPTARDKEVMSSGEYIKGLTGTDQDSAIVRVGKSAVLVPRMIYDQLQDWVKNPSHLAGDVASGYISHEMSSAPKGATAKPVRAPVVTPSEAEPFEGHTSPQTESASETPAEKVPDEKQQSAARSNTGASAREQARARAVGRAKVKVAEAETAAEDFREDGTSSQTESAGESPDEYVPEEVTPKKITLADLADTSPKNVDRLLKQATGAKENKVVPGVKIKKQPAAQSALPADFTASPKESSVLKGYKYNADTQELDGITNTGARYRHGQVTPEHFEQFVKDAADSPGKAWNNLRNAPGVEPLGKVDANGKLTPRIKPQSMRSAEVDPETGQPEFSDVLEQKKKNLSDFIKPSAPEAETASKAPKTKKLADLSGEGDLTSLLKDSVKQAKNKTNGVSTTVDPADLAKRWGVDDKSIADTDANVRGMTDAESKAYITKLAKSYKKGTAIDPVIEVRDADNNIVSVDGRHRALAAKKAGIERIPVIVRRAVTQ